MTMTPIKQQEAEACFICITGSGSLQIKTILYYSNRNMLKWLAVDSLPKGVRLLYYRYFDNLFDALAHKLMLENLCDTSLNCVISHKNPGWEDLLESLQEELCTLTNNESELFNY